PSNGRATRSSEPGNTTQRKVEPQAVGQVKPAALAAPVITSQIAAKETAVKLAELTKPSPAISPAEPAAEESKGNSRKFSAVALPAEAAVMEAPSFIVESPSLFERTREWLIAGRNQRTHIGKALRIVGTIVIALEIAAALFLYTRWEKKRAALVQSSRP